MGARRARIDQRAAASCASRGVALPTLPAARERESRVAPGGGGREARIDDARPSGEDATVPSTRVTYGYRAALVAMLAAALGLAWRVRFVCDDAFISFTYARDLARGHGLAWFGERVEGYTNFLWVLWVALGLKLRAEPVAWAWGGSLASMVVTLLALHRLARARDARHYVAAFAVAMLATNFTFLAYGTSGLETMLQTATLTPGWLEVERLRGGADVRDARVHRDDRDDRVHRDDRDDRDGSTRRARVLAFARASLLFALAILTRLDSVVYVAVLGLALLARARPSRPSQWSALLLPAGALLGGWFAFKLAYYGDLLPNTFHAKAGAPGEAMSIGAVHAARFLHWYGLWPLLLLGLGLAAYRRRLAKSALPLALVGAWLAYVVLVGGDFMEFRFFVPAMPPLFLALAELLCTDVTGSKLPRPELTGALATAVLGLLSWLHATTFVGMTADWTLDSVEVLGTFYGHVHGDWPRLGTALGRELEGTGATLACNGVGAIPFYRELPTVDQLGLTDAWVARHGVHPDAAHRRPGHQRFAPLSYLRERGVTFVLGSPTLVPLGFLRGPAAASLAERWLPRALGPAAVPVARFVLVAIPVDERQAIVGWYLTPSPAVSARIAERGWEQLEVGAGL